MTRGDVVGDGDIISAAERYSTMSYASVAAKDAPPESSQPHPDRAYLEHAATSSHVPAPSRQVSKGRKGRHGEADGASPEPHSSDEDGSTKRTERTAMVNKAKNHHHDLPSTTTLGKVRLALPDNPLLLLLPQHFIGLVLATIYIFAQVLISTAFAPRRPRSVGPLHRTRGRVAVIGGGLTGVASAAHLIGHGFEVTIFEEHNDLGGIWSRVNTTSGLQLNSTLYRFFPSIKWSASFPKRAEILSEIARVADDYDLYARARLGTRVTSVTRHKASSTEPAKYGHARWIVNGDEEVIFDGLIVAVGTCGKPKMIELPGQDKFKGKVVHSSELDGLHLKGKRVAVVGAGASGVEAVQLALDKDAANVSLLARSPHWFIPRNLVISTSLALQPFGREMPLSFIPEGLIKLFHYRSAAQIAPKQRVEGTPIVNDEFLDAVRDSRIQYLIGDVKGCVTDGVKFNRRANGTKPDSEGKETTEKADIIVLATGFTRPSVDFLPDDLFPQRGEGTDMKYDRPNLYLQNFSVADWSVCLTNSAYVDAIGTAGHVHIGVYARMLALMLAEPNTRPLPADMRMWVDLIEWIKRNAPGGAMGFFTYSEMVIWHVGFVLQKSSRLRWAPFLFLGWGMPPLPQ